LAKHGITLGPATLAAKQQEQAAKLPDQATAQDADEVLVLSDEETITNNNEDINIELPSALGDISINSKSSNKPSPKMTPTKNVMFNSGASSGQSTTDTMPPLLLMTAAQLLMCWISDVNGVHRVARTSSWPDHPTQSITLLLLSIPAQGFSLTITNTRGSISGSPSPCPT
jgi:hypothetical protein